MPLVVLPQIWLWGEYSAYRNVDFYGEPSLYFRVGPNDSVAFSCAEVDDGTVAVFVEGLQGEYQQWGNESLEQIHEPRPHGGKNQTICEEKLEEESRLRVWHSQVFVLPVGLANGLATAHFVGIFLILILASSVMGSEYRQGTIRSVLVRGVGRRYFLASKAILLVLLTAGALIVVLVPLYISGLIATSLVPGGMELATSGEWSTVLLMFVKVIFALLPYISLALFLTVLTSSTTFGIALSIGYILAEGIVISFFGFRFDRFDWFQEVLNLLMGPGAAGWLMETGVRATGQDAAFFPLDKVQSNLRAFFVLLAYIVALGGAAFWIIQRKDIPASKGD